MYTLNHCVFPSFRTNSWENLVYHTPDVCLWAGEKRPFSGYSCISEKCQRSIYVSHCCAPQSRELSQKHHLLGCCCFKQGQITAICRLLKKREISPVTAPLTFIPRGLQPGVGKKRWWPLSESQCLVVQYAHLERRMQFSQSGFPWRPGEMSSYRQTRGGKKGRSQIQFAQGNFSEGDRAALSVTDREVN